MLRDIEIAKQSSLLTISQIASKIDLLDDELELFGKYKAKISDAAQRRLKNSPDGKLVLVTAINPTPAGEGKTTTTVGLGQAMARIGKKAVIALREPSLGPVFGVKGGAAGGGYAQVVPMEDINLHFTGDIHAVTAANNLLAALVDNHIHQGNSLSIDPRRILWKRCLDINDRTLRNLVCGLGGKAHGFPREDHFQISVASEIMAILCLADGISDLKHRIGNILLGYTFSGEAVFARDLCAEGAAAALLKDALKPNLVQTLENTPAIMHGGPFANIAHGCNSITATKLALKLGDYCITEAGFGSDLGAEKFFDLKCRAAGLTPSATVIVATVRALKYNGGVPKSELGAENTEALSAGLPNLGVHLENMQKFGVPVVVAINRFETDTKAELKMIEDFCRGNGADFALSDVFAKGGEGGVALADAVVRACEKPVSFRHLYPLDMPVDEKIKTVAREIYRAGSVVFTETAKKSMKEIELLGLNSLPICIAKTQYSLSDNPALLGAPSGFTLTVSDMRLSSGAGFVVVLTGDVMTMPGLPKKPAAEAIDVDENGNISGLF